MRSVLLLLSLFFASAGVAAEKADSAAAFPSKPIRWLVGFAPGASNDVIARVVATRLTELWGRQVIIDNRPGAGGMIAGEVVAHGSPAFNYP